MRRTAGPNGERYCWWQCTVMGGREGRDVDAVELARGVEDLGAGEILLNCIDNDGCGKGFDIELVRAVSGVRAGGQHSQCCRDLHACVVAAAVSIEPRLFALLIQSACLAGACKFWSSALQMR